MGGFDERFFMYAEDLDLCRRIGEVSKTMYYPGVSIYHAYGKGSYKNRKLLKYHICSVVNITSVQLLNISTNGGGFLIGNAPK